jgi:cysteinyl-tRNA synthetase
MPNLRLYNSLTREKEEFKPLDPAHVRVYACGPTVYSYAHIGNARMAVVFDLLARVLREIYPKVTYASNITDIDDKIMAASQDTGEPVDVITRKFEKIYNEDMAALGVPEPDVQPRATETISEMIGLCEKLIARGHAYAAEGHVLFSVPSFPAYGGLSGRSRDEQIAGARVDVAPYKKDPADFVLWKPSSADQVGWDSPWGRGRPGWHIECSAMAEKHLGLPFDIHGGGADLKFPHHENEIAQSCCAHGHDKDLSAFAKVWVHNGFVTVENEKMSKSIGNIRLVHELIKDHKGEVLRLALLSAQYSQPLSWSEDLIAQMKTFLDGLYRVLYDLRDVTAEHCDVPKPIFEELCDDLNTPMALSIIKDIARAAASEKDFRALAKGRLLAAGSILGILQQDPAGWLGYGGSDDKIEKLLVERTEAKKTKNFKRADEIRDEVKVLGYTIEDTPDGPKARKIS